MITFYFSELFEAIHKNKMNSTTLQIKSHALISDLCQHLAECGIGEETAPEFYDHQTFQDCKAGLEKLEDLENLLLWYVGLEAFYNNSLQCAAFGLGCPRVSRT